MNKISHSTVSLLFAAALTCGGGVLASAYGEAYTFTVGTEIPLATDYVTTSGCSIQTDNATIGSTHKNSTVTLNLNNTTAGDYYLQWRGGADGLTAEYTATVTRDSDSSVIASGNFHQRNTDTGTSGSKWTTVQIAMLPLRNLPAGAFTVKLAISSTTGSYAGNYGNFKVLAADSAFMTLPQTSYSPSAASAAGTLFVSRATAGASDIGSTSGSTVLDFLVNVSEKSTCGMNYKTGANKCSCTLNWCLLDLNGTQVWPASDVATDAVTDTGSWSLTVEHAHDFGTISAGNYILLATVSNESGSYAGNWGNFAFTATPIVETYYTVTVPTVAHATATVTGATEKETTETATIYSAVSNANVTVAYTADAHYTLSGDATTNIVGIAADATITAPTASEDAQWTEGAITTDATTGDVHIGADANSTGKLVVNSGSYTATGYLAIGCGNNSTGTLEVNGGSCSVSGAIYMSNHNNGNGSGSVSYLTITNGAVSAASFSSGWAAPSISYATVSGEGKLNFSGEMVLACGGGNTNIVTVSDSGALTADSIRLGEWGNNTTYKSGAIVTLENGSITANQIEFRQKNKGGNACYFSQKVRVKGGVLTIGKMFSNGTVAPYDEFILEGGTLRASGASTSFIADSYNSEARWLKVYLTSGTIDTQTYDVTVPATISGDAMAFTKTGTGTLTFTGALPASGTITVAKKGGKVVIPSTATGISAGATTKVTDDGSTKVFAYNAPTYTLTLPTLTTGLAAIVTANGETVAANTDGTYSIPEEAAVVVTITAAPGYVVDAPTTYTIGSMTADTDISSKMSLPSKVGVAVAYTNCWVTAKLEGYGSITTVAEYNKTAITLDCDWSGFTGTIKVTGEGYTKFGPNWKGAPKAKWIVDGHFYLFGNSSGETDAAYNGTISFGQYLQSKQDTFHMFNGTQDLTLAFGGSNADIEFCNCSGIGGYHWNANPNAAASVKVVKEGTGKFTTNLAGARDWEIQAGEVVFQPLTSVITQDSGARDMFVKDCTNMLVKSGAKVSGFYGTLPGFTFTHTLSNLTVESGATFAPTVGRTWNVTSATLDGATLTLKDTGALQYGATYTLLQASSALSAEGLTVDGDTTLFDVKVDGLAIKATFKGYGPYVVAAGETLVYTGNVKDSTKMIDTALGIEIKTGGKLVIDLATMGFPGCDGTRENDGSLTLPKLTLPSGSTIKDCVRIISPRGYHGVFFVASDGYGYITFDPGSAVGFTIILH